MTQEELEARLAAMGGASALQYAPVAETKTVKNPAHKLNGGTSYTVPEEITVQISRWWNPTTGQVLEAYQGPDGAYAINRQGVDKSLVNVGSPTAGAAQKPTNVYIGTNPTTGRPTQVTEYPDGSKTYDDTQVPAAANTDTPQARQAAEEEREKQWNRDNGGLYETHAARREREAREAKANETGSPKPPTERVNPEDPTRRQAWNPQAADGTGAWEDAGTVAQKPEAVKPPEERINPADPTRRQVWNPRAGDGRGAWEDGGPVAQKPEKSEIREIDGEQVEIIRDPKTGQVVDTKPVKPATTGAAGIPMPAIIVGQSEAALRGYADQLTAEVAAGRMTPARRDALIGQALQFAQVAVQDATLVQRQTESQRNAAVNVATTLYTGSMNGFQNALSFVSKLNGDLPPGSDLGGKAFVALLGMQMIMAERSGLYDVQRQINAERDGKPQPPAPAPPARLTDPTDPKAVDADRERIMADPVFKPQPPVDLPPATTEAATPPPTEGQGQGQAPPPPAAPAAQQPTPAPAPAPAAAAAPAPLSPGLPGMMMPNSPTVDPAPAAPLPGATPPGEAPPPYNPPPGEPGHVPGSPVGMAPPMPPQQEYAVLQQPTQTQPPTPLAVPDLSSNPALLASQAAAKPFWRMTPQEIEAYRAAGVPEQVIMQTPRWGAA